LELRQKLAGGAVLRQVAGFSQPIVVGRDCQFHDHATIELVFHPTGRGVTTMQGGGEVAFGEGDVVLYAPSVRHDQRTAENGVDCCVQIEPLPDVSLKGCLHVGRIDDPVLRSELEFLATRSPGRSATGDALLNLRTTAVLLQLLELAFVRGPAVASPAERHVGAAELYVQNHYACIESVEEIAAAVGVGPDHLRHAFRRRRGRSLVGYLGEVRLERARTLLTHAELPIKEIATLCGYRDEYYFSAVFKKRAGLAPGRYRDQTRAGRAPAGG
jgi:AraC-like DNA-binding protein